VTPAWPDLRHDNQHNTVTDSSLMAQIDYVTGYPGSKRCHQEKKAPKIQSVVRTQLNFNDFAPIRSAELCLGFLLSKEELYALQVSQIGVGFSATGCVTDGKLNTSHPGSLSALAGPARRPHGQPVPNHVPR